jgi:hypothetical protein
VLDDDEIIELTGETAARSVPLDDVADLLERLADDPPQLAGLTAAQLVGLAGDLAAIVHGYAEIARERGEQDSVELGELREMLADMLYDDEHGEATLEPAHHGATLAGAVALANHVLEQLAGE